MKDVILAGDVDVGDVIVLPSADDAVLVSRVRLGQGGLIFTVTSASADPPGEEHEQPVFDLESGRELGRAVTESRVANGMFPSPGWGRDLIYCSTGTIARIWAGD